MDTDQPAPPGRYPTPSEGDAVSVVSHQHRFFVVDGLAQPCSCGVEVAMGTVAAYGVSVVSRPCMSRHFGNEGKPRPPLAWNITYGCVNEHVITTEVCDRCATSLVDRQQHCARCLRPMLVTDLAAVTT